MRRRRSDFRPLGAAGFGATERPGRRWVGWFTIAIRPSVAKRRSPWAGSAIAAASPALLAALGDSDRFAAWSIRQALLAVDCDDQKALVDAFLDPRRREPALLLADESWSIPILRALVEAFAKTPEPVVRGRMITCLAGQYRRYPEWSGAWFGPDPLAAGFPKKTEPWTAEGMAVVLRGLSVGIKDADASVRYQAILGLQSVGVPAAGLVREAFRAEPDADNQAALADALGALNDATSTRLLLPVVVDPKRDEAVRASALDSLNRLRGRDVVRARLTVLYDENGAGGVGRPGACRPWPATDSCRRTTWPGSWRISRR